MEERKTRRNKRIMIVSAILVLLAAILCLGGITFAKYVSNGKGKASATVAKWGCVVTVTADDLFGSNYKKEGTVSVIDKDGTSGFTISADATDEKRVAPGSTGSMTISISGKAEVATVLKFTENTAGMKNISLDFATYTPEGGSEVTGTTYTPIKWTLKEGASTDALVGADKTTLTACLGVLKTKLGIATGDTSVVKAPGANWGNADGSAITYTLSWEWAFDNTGSTAAYKDRIDEFDTILAAAAEATAKGDTYTAPDGISNVKTELAIDFTIAIEQSATGATA